MEHSVHLIYVWRGCNKALRVLPFVGSIVLHEEKVL